MKAGHILSLPSLASWLLRWKDLRHILFFDSLLTTDTEIVESSVHELKPQKVCSTPLNMSFHLKYVFVEPECCLTWCQSMGRGHVRDQPVVWWLTRRRLGAMVRKGGTEDPAQEEVFSKGRTQSLPPLVRGHIFFSSTSQFCSTRIDYRILLQTCQVLTSMLFLKWGFWALFPETTNAHVCLGALEFVIFADRWYSHFQGAKRRRPALSLYTSEAPHQSSRGAASIKHSGATPGSLA